MEKKEKTEEKKAEWTPSSMAKRAWELRKNKVKRNEKGRFISSKHE